MTLNISIIGYGNMAKAMTRGITREMVHVSGSFPFSRLREKVPQADEGAMTLRVAAPSLPIGITTEGIKTYPSNLSVIPNADIIILAVKPAQMATVLTEIMPTLPAECLLISVAAGLSLSWFQHHMHGARAIIRAMPNIAASVGTSATPLFTNEHVSDAQKQAAEQLFNLMGITSWVKDERDMDCFTALSGSGPAYVFLFMESMVNAAMALGLDENVAKAFTLQTVKGAVTLAEQRDCSLSTLRHQVTSPAGTTAAAIKVFNDQKLESIVSHAMRAAFERAEQLKFE